jgi:hypothetical protein
MNQYSPKPTNPAETVSTTMGRRQRGAVHDLSRVGTQQLVGHEPLTSPPHGGGDADDAEEYQRKPA